MLSEKLDKGDRVTSRTGEVYMDLGWEENVTILVHLVYGERGFMVGISWHISIARLGATGFRAVNEQSNFHIFHAADHSSNLGSDTKETFS